VRLANPKVQSTLVSVNGALEFLEGVGFILTFPDTPSQHQLQQSSAIGKGWLPNHSSVPLLALNTLMALNTCR
jgi:hypothetical protein